MPDLDSKETANSREQTFESKRSEAVHLIGDNADAELCLRRAATQTDGLAFVATFNLGKEVK